MWITLLITHEFVTVNFLPVYDTKYLKFKVQIKSDEELKVICLSNISPYYSFLPEAECYTNDVIQLCIY